MVARMMRWPPWPPLHSKKFQVKLVLLRLEAPLGLQRPDDAAGGGPTTQEANAETAAQGKKKLLTAEVRWKGPKTTLTSLRRPSIRRNCTRALEALDLRPSKEGEEGEDGEEGSLSGSVSIVEWNEEFRSVCCLTSHKDNAYHPWEVAFSVLDSNVSCIFSHLPPPLLSFPVPLRHGFPPSFVNTAEKGSMEPIFGTAAALWSLLCISNQFFLFYFIFCSSEDWSVIRCALNHPLSASIHELNPSVRMPGLWIHPPLSLH